MTDADARHISCQELVELVTAYLEGALSTEQTSVVEEHLHFCDGCVTYLDQMRTTIVAVGRVKEEELSDEMRARLSNAFRGWRER